MPPKQYIEELLQAIDEALERLNRAVPKLQSKMYERLEVLATELNKVGNNVKADTQNLRLLSKIRAELDSIVRDADFRREVEEFKRSFDKVERINERYFTSIAETRGIQATLSELKKQVVEDVEVRLSPNRVSQALTDRVHEILRTSITSGSTYASMLKGVRGFLETNNNEFVRYAKQITTDALNQYNAQYTKLMSEDLGLVWYQYVGSLLTTSREFCVELVAQRWVHRSEIPALLEGKVNGKRVRISPKNDLPLGMIDGTNAQNFQVRRGGHNCGHQLIPVSTALVPENIKSKFAASV